MDTPRSPWYSCHSAEENGFEIQSLFTAGGGTCFCTYTAVPNGSSGVAQYQKDRNRWRATFNLSSNYRSAVGHGDYIYIVHVYPIAVAKSETNKLRSTTFVFGTSRPPTSHRHIFGTSRPPTSRPTRHDSNERANSVMVYNIGTGRKCGQGQLTCRRTDVSMAIIDNTLYVGGGQDEQRLFNTVEAISLSDYKCHLLSPTPTFKCSLAAVAGRLVSTGGSTSNSVSAPATSAASMLNMSTGQWQLLPAMDDVRVNHGVCAVGDDTVAVFGGTSTEFNSHLELKRVEALKIQL